MSNQPDIHLVDKFSDSRTRVITINLPLNYGSILEHPKFYDIIACARLSSTMPEIPSAKVMCR